MQNKPNLLNRQTNLTSVLTKDYENKPTLAIGENKPNQTQPVVSLPVLSIVEVSNPLLGFGAAVIPTGVLLRSTQWRNLLKKEKFHLSRTN